MRAKLAFVGGGSLFVPSIINGIARVMRESRLPFEVELALYDIEPKRAERVGAYSEVVRRAWGVPLRAYVAGTRAKAFEGADVVLLSVWLREEHERLDAFFQRLGFQLPEEGPGVAAWAVACAPWSLGVAAEMRACCPGALLVTLMNPTDVIAGALSRIGGVRAAGLCVEVDGLRGALAYYFRVPYEAIVLRHAGVNHDGWVLGLEVAGQDGYDLWKERWAEIARDPDYHPGNRGLWTILRLTGHLRSSAYHNWPLEVTEDAEHRALWARWQGKREIYVKALEEALRTGEPICDPADIHPERSKLNYPYTGITVGKLMQSLATGWANVIPLQVPNCGAIVNFPSEAVVEVPTLVQGKVVQPLPVGEVPEWLMGYTRLLAIQRQLIVEYLASHDLLTLKRALVTLPMFASVQQMSAFAEALHREFDAANGSAEKGQGWLNCVL